MRVILWNSGSEDLWGVRSAEVLDMHFADVDSGIPKEELLPKIRQVLNGSTKLAHVDTHAVNRKGKKMELRFTVAELAATDGKGDGSIILAEELNAPASKGDSKPAGRG